MTRSRNLILHGAAVLALVAAAAGVFWGSLGNPFHFDDSLFLENPDVTNPGDLRALLRPTQVRPLTYLTFLANYRAGGTDPSGYHRLNLVLHLLNVAAVYWLVCLLLGRGPELAESPVRRLVPLAAAAIFALHPIQSEPVNYVYQRSTLLAALFGLVAMCTFLMSRRHKNRAGWLALCAASTLLAVASKESAVAVPLLFAAWMALEAKAGSAAGSARHTRWFLILLAAFALGSGLWTLHLLHRFGERTTGMRVSEVSPVEYFAAELQVVPRYIAQIAWPAGLSVDPDPRLAPLVSLRAALCLALLAGLAGAAFAARRSRPLVAFLVAAFFLLLAPTSSFVPSADLMFEHRVYFPMAAVATLAALAVAGGAGLVARGRPALQRALFSGLLLGLAAGYGAASRARTHVWGNNIRLWEDAIAKAPVKARAHYNLGVAYLPFDRARARASLARAVELRPEHAEALYNLGWLEQTSGRYDRARQFYDAAVAAKPEFWQALHSLGNIDVVQGRFEAARGNYREVLRLKPDYWPTLLNLGTLDLQREDFSSALEPLRKLSELRPDFLDARYLLAYACVGMRDLTQAEAQLRHLETKDRDGLYRDRITDLRRRAASP